MDEEHEFLAPACAEVLGTLVEELGQGRTWSQAWASAMAVAAQLLRSPADWQRFAASSACAALQRKLADLRRLPIGEPMRVITVRLPASMHGGLISEAHELRTSLNQLCIAKLLQPIDPDYVPTDVGGKE